MTFNASSNDVKLYNSRPDFIGLGKHSTVAVGEMESSPFTQMVVASLGHTMRYMLGVTLSKRRTVQLYWIDKNVDMKFFDDSDYYSPVRIATLTTSSLDITNSNNLEELLNYVVKAVIFIEKNRQQENQAVFLSLLTQHHK